MDRARLVTGIGLLLLLVGLLLSLVPQYTPSAAGEPLFTGTHWVFGGALALVGLILSMWGRSRGRAAAPAPPPH